MNTHALNGHDKERKKNTISCAIRMRYFADRAYTGSKTDQCCISTAIKLNANGTIYSDMEIFLRRLLGVGVKKIVPIEMDLYANTHSYSLTTALTTSLLYTYKL